MSPRKALARALGIAFVAISLLAALNTALYLPPGKQMLVGMVLGVLAFFGTSLYIAMKGSR